MYNGAYHIERMSQGKKIIIDMAFLGGLDNGYYEVMVLDSKGYDLDSFFSKNEDDAIKAFHEFDRKYPETSKPLSGKYAKLKTDLIKALEIAKNAAGKSADGGTCNLDAPILYLPRWKESLVRQAAHEAGTRFFTSSAYGVKRYVFATNASGQADARTAAAEAFSEFMKTCGYDASVFYMID